MIGSLVVDAGVQPLVIAAVKIVGHADLRVGQVRKNGSLADFKDLRFEARPQAFGLGRTRQGVIVAGALSGTTAVGVHKQARRGRLGPKSPL